MRKVWQGMNLMVGCEGKKGNNSVEGDEGYANDLNKFYARFDCHDFVQEREECKSALLESLLHDRERIVIDKSEVRKAMLALKPNKAPGPDGVKPSVLKKCAEQLCGIMCEIFNMSLKECKVPKAWKTS
ncbi:Non-LTR (Long terminal repeat) retrotransposon and domain-containing protein [Elysia marginata]|uniref:Non-LTR (Long terminal repeat) retrotransposon and domain-containing protein n=1 Tax=Elysia marginata TaxID=1093978 RepID=A0AAV4FYI4_9GAST|nr:Non-LTR (Long terminal repeat) retrotransposon and domain-containing protein [Elysia marginata]